MIQILGLQTNIYYVYLLQPITIKITSVLVKITCFMFILYILSTFIYSMYLPYDDILFQDGIHRLNLALNKYEMILIFFTLQLFQQYGSYLKSSEILMILICNVIALIYFMESYDWLLTIITWEFINITLYLIVSMKNGSEKALSASIKYFLLSALTTSFLLLGVTLLYANFGTIHFDNFGMLYIFVAHKAIFPLSLILLTIFFKIGAAPFHNWSPDLLDAIPTTLTSWMNSIPKFGILFFLSIFSYYLIPLNSFILFIGILSVMVGSIGLSNQSRIKRFFAYSAISHIGFLLQALGSSEMGLDHYIYYLIIYGLTTIGVFAILLSINDSQNESVDFINKLSGLYYQNPYLSLSFTFLLFSLMGIPPLAGFFAKLTVQTNMMYLGYYSIAILSILGSMISSVNYQNLIKILNVDYAYSSSTSTRYISSDVALIISFITAFLMFFFFYPSNLLSLFTSISITI